MRFKVFIFNFFMKIGFFGTPELAAAVLLDLIDADDVEIAYVVSQPDRPV